MSSDQKVCPACRKSISIIATVGHHCERNVWISRWLPFKTENFLNLVIAIAALAAVWVTFWSSKDSLELSKKQLALQLRPFIAIENVQLKYEPDLSNNRYWLVVGFKLHNYGEQPAHELVRRTDKVIVITAPSDFMAKLEQTYSDPAKSVTERDNVLLEIISGRRQLLREVFEFLRKQPFATQSQINVAFEKRGVHCYGDITEHFPLPTVLVPGQDKHATSTRDSGGDYGQDVASGKALLVYYVNFSYEGATSTFPNYSTSYFGYCDELVQGGYVEKANRFARLDFIEYRQWMEREGL